jgi:integrase/recombinase XerD
LQLRTRALFYVILSSAARITEALSLDRDQLQDRQAVVIQKGGHEKLIVISKTAEAAVADYLAARSDSCEALFVTHGLTSPTTRVTYKQNRRGPQFGWDQLRAKLGIRRFTSHMIRHTTATMLLRQKVDSLVIAKHMGQRGLQAIQGYAEVGLDTRHEMLQVLDERIRRAS